MPLSTDGLETDSEFFEDERYLKNLSGEERKNKLNQGFMVKYIVLVFVLWLDRSIRNFFFFVSQCPERTMPAFRFFVIF